MGETTRIQQRGDHHHHHHMGGASFAPAGGVLASLCGIPKFLITRIRGIVQGQLVSILVDNGATHNFLDAEMVQMRGITTVDF